MSKKTYVDVLGLKKGSKPEVVATFSNRPLANWHVKNTLEGKGYDQLLVRNSNKKGSDFVNDVIAEDKGTYVLVDARMQITDLDTVTATTRTGTLLEFILDDVIKSKTGLNKLEINKDVGETDITTLGVITVHEENEPTEFGKIKTRLTRELLDTYLGTDKDEEEIEEEEVEEEEEIEEDIEEEEEEEEEVEEDIEEEIDEEEIEEEEYEEVEEDIEEELEEVVEEDEDEEDDELDEDDFEDLEDLDL